jgi:hypothetical protein
MRGFQVSMFVLCLSCGIYLLVNAPEFFLPDRYSPARGWQFSPIAARILGGGLLAIAAMALIFFRHHYHGAGHRLPGATIQKIYFVLAILALGLITLALNLAEPAATLGLPIRSVPPIP